METLLFIDDERDPSFIKKWHGIPVELFDVHVVRSSQEAQQWIEKNGHPNLISFDHDLGGDDTSMVFLAWYQNMWIDQRAQNPALTVPGFLVHSQNPVGARAISQFMYNWHSHALRGTFDKK